MLETPMTNARRTTVRRSASRLVTLLISSGAAKITAALSPIIAAGIIAGAPFSGPSLPESVMNRRLRSQKARTFPSAVPSAARAAALRRKST